MKYELTDLTNAWKVLESFGKPQMTFSLYKEDETKTNNILGLIRSMQNFNNKDNELVASKLQSLINMLPTHYYNEGNRNNGSYIFNQITLKGDDTIILRGVGLVKEDYQDNLEKVKRVVNLIGKDMLADEYTVKSEQYGYNMHETVIRLWWD